VLLSLASRTSMPSLFYQDPRIDPYFFVVIKMDGMSSTLFFLKKGNASFDLLEFHSPWSLQNLGLSFFWQKDQFFSQFLSQKNILETVINLSITSKNHQRNQKSIWVHVYFFINFKCKKKTYNMNSPRQMKPFDANIIHFCDLNRCQRHVSFFIVEIWRPLSARNKK
jgi:hypothetical protein